MNDISARIDKLRAIDAHLVERFELPPAVGALVLELGRLVLANEKLRARLYDELDLSSHELSALLYVGLGEQVTPKDIARNLSITSGSTTALIDRMVKADLFQRDPHPVDRRSVQLTLTSAGEAAHEVIVKAYVGVAESVLGRVERERIEDGVAVMRELYFALLGAS